MRVAPIGLVARDRASAFDIGVQSGALTHGHPSGYLSAGYMAALVWDLARGTSLSDSCRGADELLGGYAGSEELAFAIRKAQALAKKGVPNRKAIESIGEGWVAEEALAIALLCASTANGATAEDIAGALWRSVLHSGDSDSTGAITGNLLGAMYGATALPQAWVAEVELRDLVERLSRDLFSAIVLEETECFRFYPTKCGKIDPKGGRVMTSDPTEGIKPMSQEALDDLDASSRSFWSQQDFSHLNDPAFQVAADEAAAAPNWQDMSGNPEAMADMEKETFIAVEVLNDQLAEALATLDEPEPKA